LESNNFPNSKQIEILQILNFILQKKNYPQDLCGLFSAKIPLLEQAEKARQAEQATTPPESNLRLSSQKGVKVNFIRLINCLCELSFFTDKQGNDITKKEVFHTFGQALNQDFSTFHNDLSTTKAAAN
jgi:hypothetical protein